MTWDTNKLQTEVLEQFADVRWTGIAAARVGLADSGEAGVNVTHEVPWTVTRKSDADFVEQLKETAATRPFWTARELAAAAGDDSLGASVTAGQVLGSLPGWQSRLNGRVAHNWVNPSMLGRMLAGRQDVRAIEVAAELNVHLTFVTNALKALGWTSRCVRKRMCWNAPTPSHETVEVC